MSTGNYRELKAWQRGMDLVAATYRVATALPAAERFGLREQLRRWAVSVPANIAEGQARQGPREFVRFLTIASGSLAELETHCLLCIRLGYVAPDEVQPVLTLADEIGRLIFGLLRSLRDAPTRPPLAPQADRISRKGST